MTPRRIRLSRGQVSRTYCYNGGVRVAAIDRPLREGEYYVDGKIEPRTYRPCPNPYDFPHNAPAPRSHDEAHEFWLAAFRASQAEAADSTPDELGERVRSGRSDEDSFSVKADLKDLLSEARARACTQSYCGAHSTERTRSYPSTRSSTT